jgi:hypothetical protein
MASTDRGERLSLAVGAGLLALYIAQAALGLQLPVLVRLQHDERYKVVTGCVLAAYLLHQSLMARRRVFDPVGVVRWHKLAGACAPLLLYLHASRFAYGYLFLLSMLFLGTVGLALLHRVSLRARTVYAWWFVLHIVTASCLVVLSGYHAVLALAYK